MSTDVVEQTSPSVDIATNTGDHDVFAHYVDRDEVADAVINGWPVIALCGKIWVPFRDPSRYPICPTCEEIFAKLFAAGSNELS
jgi:hypothetical protein